MTVLRQFTEQLLVHVGRQYSLAITKSFEFCSAIANLSSYHRLTCDLLAIIHPCAYAVHAMKLKTKNRIVPALDQLLQLLGLKTGLWQVGAGCDSCS